jgi:para-aminobenzoate synthetase component 1
LEQSSSEERKAFLERHSSAYIFCALSYDLKNQYEASLLSSNPDRVETPGSFWVVYKRVLRLNGLDLTIYAEENALLNEWAYIDPSKNETKFPEKESSSINLKLRTPKDEYLKDIENIQSAIRSGSVYELNYCQEFYAEHCSIDPLPIFKRMLETNAAPFSVLFKWKQHCLLSASPERFLSKRGDVLVAQPIKGTRRRLSDIAADNRQKEDLQHCVKERAENVMIVDLMRNDLARCCETGTVAVEELFGIYSFATVHQMISTVTGRVKTEFNFDTILQNTFPMGSMTGAPKIEAMKLIEQFEKVKRGWFSGSIGYLAPDGDFDLNVVIRTLIYNVSTGYLSLQTGGAITIDSVPELEYQESLLKAEAWMKLLS